MAKVRELVVPAIETQEGTLEKVLGELYIAELALLADGKFPVALGGEHSLTPPLVSAAARKFPNLSVLQIDAHADLRESYHGNPASHACAMRRVVEVCPAVQVGIRSLSVEEAEAIPRLRTKIYWAKDIARAPVEKIAHLVSSSRSREPMISRCASPTLVRIARSGRAARASVSISP